MDTNILTAGQAAVMRMEPGWLPNRRKPGKLLPDLSGGEARQLETQAVMI